MAMRLGILAGGGSIARQLFNHCQQNDIAYHVVAIQGQADAADVAAHPHTWVRLGAGQAIHDALRAFDATDVIMIGNIRRPTLLGLCPDWFAIKLLPRLGWAMVGDDSLLRGVISIFEGYGITVRGMKELMPGLLAPAGVWTAAQPDATATASIAYGIDVARQHGIADKGQSVVVQGHTTVGTETRDGTDALLRRSKVSGAGGVLVKLCKPQQDKRADLPTIGRRTVENAAAAGLAGIAVSAGNTLVDDREATIAAANQRGLFIVGVDA